MSIASAMALINASSVGVDGALANMSAALEDAGRALAALTAAQEQLDEAQGLTIAARGEGSRGAPMLASTCLVIRNNLEPVKDHFLAAEHSLKEVLIPLAAGYREKAQAAIAALGV
ncbi:MAG TPA: hypothetical protein VIY48_17510 [Candidatus Paceibacterota bacterium]